MHYLPLSVPLVYGLALGSAQLIVSIEFAPVNQAERLIASPGHSKLTGHSVKLFIERIDSHWHHGNITFL